MWLCHGWGWQPPQTASHIHLRHVQSDWAYWYAIHGHTVSPLHSYTHPTPWLRFWSSGSLVESKWCDYVMVEANSHLKLLPISILDIYKVFEHIDMLSIEIWVQPYTVLPSLLGSDFGVRGHLCSQNDAFLSWLMLTATSNCFSHPYTTHTRWLSTLICYPWAYSITPTQVYPAYMAQILGYVVTCGVKMMWLCHGWGWQSPQTASHNNIRHAQSIWAHWDTVHWHIIAALHSFTHPTWLRF
jgi:hypothetical protein